MKTPTWAVSDSLFFNQSFLLQKIQQEPAQPKDQLPKKIFFVKEVAFLQHDQSANLGKATKMVWDMVRYLKVLKLSGRNLGTDIPDSWSHAVVCWFLRVYLASTLATHGFAGCWRHLYHCSKSSSIGRMLVLPADTPITIRLSVIQCVFEMKWRLLWLGMHNTLKSLLRGSIFFVCIIGLIMHQEFKLYFWTSLNALHLSLHQQNGVGHAVYKFSLSYTTSTCY